MAAWIRRLESISTWRGNFNKALCNNSRVPSNNGQPNGIISATNGQANGRVSASNDQPNGSVSANNGQPNGRVAASNGQPNGRVAANNGQPNGRVSANNGRPNGSVSASNGQPNGGVSANNGRPNGFPTSPNGPYASSYLKSNRLFCTSSVKFIAGVFGGLFTLAVAYYKSRFKDNSIYSALMNGTNTVDTAVQSTEVVIKRTKEQQKIRNLIETDDALFGVIVGPTGTGKTHLTRLACCEPHTPGILYHEIGDASSFPQELANTIGMRLKSSFNVLDLLIWNVISEQYVSYHTLAADPEEATHYVLDKLAETSKRVKKKGHVPCLVIDGVDMLAKKNEDLFVKLVDQAKLYANAKKLYLVLVSSEGHIMPLIDKTSSRTRMAKVIQILDIDDGDAIKYLTERGVPQKASKHVVKHVGGRFVHLKKAVEMKRLHPTLDENDLFDQITSELYRLYVRPGRMAINYHHDKAKVIIKRLLDEPETSDPSLASQPYPKIDPQELCAGLKGKDLEEMDAAKTCLVNENLLRYDADGNLTWHSRLVHGALAKEFCSGPKRV